MPRQPRLVIAGYPCHIILRGNNKSAVFFIECLKDAKEETKSKLYAYCLMTNHVHLLIEPLSNDGISKTMQSVGRRYVQYINKAYKRTGTLWEGRFKSSLISRDGYLLACGRYIESNPVRAKMVEKPGDYPWSSYAHRAEGKSSALLDYDPAYLDLGKTEEERQLQYRSMFLDDISHEELTLIRSTTQRGGLIGDKKFINSITQVLGRSVTLKARGRPRK
jgi:putative transposase